MVKSAIVARLSQEELVQIRASLNLVQNAFAVSLPSYNDWPAHISECVASSLLSVIFDGNSNAVMPYLSRGNVVWKLAGMLSSGLAPMQIKSYEVVSCRPEICFGNVNLRPQLSFPVATRTNYYPSAYLAQRGWGRWLLRKQIVAVF